MKTLIFVALVCILLPLALAEAPYPQESLAPPSTGAVASAVAAAAAAPENIDYRIKNVPHYIYVIEKPVVHHALPYVKHHGHDGLYTVPVFHGLSPIHSSINHAVPVVHHAEPVVHHTVPVVHHAEPVVHHAVPVVHHAEPVVHHTVPVVHHAEPVVHHTVPVVHHAEPVVHHQVSKW